MNSLDSLYASVERTIEKVNRINSSLSVALDKFQTVTGLHDPPRSISCGTMAMLACASAIVEGELLRIDFHLLDEIPGIALNETLLPPDLGNVYMLWVAFLREIEACLADMQEIMPEYLEALQEYREICGETDHKRNIAEIKKSNDEELRESALFFGEVLQKITGYMKEVAAVVKALNRVEVVAEFIRLGEHANKLCLFAPDELMQAFGSSIERFVSKIFVT